MRVPRSHLLGDPERPARSAAEETLATERAAIVAWYATEAACDVALDAMQVMGGAGYMRDHAPERLFRDMRLWTIGGGTSEIQQLTIPKELLCARGVSTALAGGYRDERARHRS